MIGRGDKKGSGISVLMARHDDDVLVCMHVLFGWVSLFNCASNFAGYLMPKTSLLKTCNSTI